MKLYKLEAVRGFAAFYVVLHHTIPHDLVIMHARVGFLFRFGQEAVILFFLLSGFVINYSFRLSNSKDFKAYFLKRFTRIYIPLFFIFVLGYFYAAIHSGHLVDPQLGRLIGNIFMLQDIPSLKPGVLVSPYMGDSPLWSLSYEWWFYMLFFPIVTYSRNTIYRDCAVYATCCISAVLYISDPIFAIRLIMYFAIWWSGVVMADLYISDKGMTFRNLKLTFSFLMLICSILSVDVYRFLVSNTNINIGLHPFLELRHMFFAVLVIAASLVWKKNQWVGFDAIFKPFLFIAPISYVIYISHVYIIADASYLNFMHNSYLEYAGYFICLLLFSYIVEQKAYPLVKRAVYRLVYYSK